jgi:hypothetical protein
VAGVAGPRIRLIERRNMVATGNKDTETAEESTRAKKELVAVAFCWWRVGSGYDLM